MLEMNTEAEHALSAALSELAVRPANQEAWTSLYQLSRPFVLSHLCRNLFGSSDLLDDAFQEVFLRLIKNCPFSELHDSSSFKLYLKFICRSVCIDLWRKNTAGRMSTLDDFPAPKDGSTSDPLSQIEAADLLQSLGRRFREKDMELLQYLLDGYSVSEIVSATGLRKGVVSVRLYRIRHLLRGFLIKNKKLETP